MAPGGFLPLHAGSRAPRRAASASRVPLARSARSRNVLGEKSTARAEASSPPRHRSRGHKLELERYSAKRTQIARGDVITARLTSSDLIAQSPSGFYILHASTVRRGSDGEVRAVQLERRSHRRVRRTARICPQPDSRQQPPLSIVASETGSTSRCLDAKNIAILNDTAIGKLVPAPLESSISRCR